MKTVMKDINPNGQKCPNCGHDYTKIEYYAGNWKRRNNGPGLIKETFSGAKHIGGLCRYCEKKKMLRRAIGFPIIGIISLIAVIVGLVLSGRNGTAGIGEMLYTLGGIILSGCVFCYGLLLLINPESPQSDEKLFSTFKYRLPAEGPDSPDQFFYSVKQMEELQKKSFST